MKTLRLGVTTIYVKKKSVKVVHHGNMGHTVEHNVKPNVDSLLGAGMFDKIKAGAFNEDIGTADYSYILEARIEVNA